MQILVDADSCPHEARDVVLRFSARLGIPVIFAANRPIPGIPMQSEKISSPAKVRMEICPPGEGSADDRIVSLAKPGDLVITRDLPLAERIVNAGIHVMDDRGTIFSEENIRERRSMRDFIVGLADSGMGIERTASYGSKELNTFANSLDRELTRLYPASG